MKILEQPFFADYGQIHLEVIGEEGNGGEVTIEDVKRGFAWWPTWVDLFLAKDMDFYTLIVLRVESLAVDERAECVSRVPFHATGATLSIGSISSDETVEFELERGTYQLQLECTDHPRDHFDEAIPEHFIRLSFMPCARPTFEIVRGHPVLEETERRWFEERWKESLA